ncbi:hypothetical protein [Paraburkholderia bannensis]|uniref:hypothetical protein n=1 Tax=Paraburkholderia bannensis TaxID=765414 RepID=UPI002AC35F64|nr:hypothetical protein [Paraburkholderia bannensis]
MTYRLKAGLAFALSVYAAIAVAGPYQAGVHQWNVKDGKLTLMSGVMTDNAAQSYLNYTFYLVNAHDKTQYQVPVVDDKDSSKFRLTITESSTGDDANEDATVVAKQDTWLLIGEKETSVDAAAPGPVNVRVYKLVSGNDGDWAYSFQLTKTVRYAKAKRYTVEKALAENANGLQ